jgi:hypothetical protein
MKTYVSVTLEFEVNRKKAMGFSHPEGPGTIWLPHSQIRNLDAILDGDLDHHSKIEVEIPQWLVERKGLDPYCEELEDEVY